MVCPLWICVAHPTGNRCRKRVGLQECGDYDHHLRTKPTLCHVDADFAEQKCVREGGVRLSIQPLGPGRLLPVHHVIVWPQTVASPKVGTAQVVFPQDDIHTALRQQDDVKPPAEIAIA